MGSLDDRLDLESRGKANPTGLSGTSDPDEYSKEAAALDDSATD